MERQEWIKEQMAKLTMPFGGAAGTSLASCSRSELQSFVETDGCEDAYPTSYSVTMEYLETNEPPPRITPRKREEDKKAEAKKT